MGLIIIQALFFFLPSYVANGVPVILAKLRCCKHWNTPIDFHYKLGGQALFGESKTWRGLIGGILAAIAMTTLQYFLYIYVPSSHFLYLFPYQFISSIWLGFLLGLGEGLGDLIKSFIKRRLNRKSSTPFFPFDQMSFVGSLFLGWIFFPIPKAHIIALLIISPLMPVVANIVAYRLGWKKVWW